MNTPITLPHIRNIAVSGRIGSGTTTLAKGLRDALGWQLLEGGALFEKIHAELGLSEVASNERPDDFDQKFEDKITRILKEEQHNIIQSHLAGFDAQGIEGVYKILVICEDAEGRDMPEIRIDRLVNRKNISVEEAKREVIERERNNLVKWRRLYADNNEGWVNWDKKYYDLVISTYSHNQDESVRIALESLKNTT